MKRVRVKVLVALSVDSEAYEDCSDIPAAVALEVKRFLSEEGAFRGCGVKVSVDNSTAPTDAGLPQDVSASAASIPQKEDSV